MKKKLTSLATFMKKSSNSILFFIFLISFTQSCKKENLNPVSMKVEEAKKFFNSKINLNHNQNDKGFKNLENATILWEKAIISKNEKNEEIINVPLSFKNQFKHSFTSEEKTSLNESIFLEIVEKSEHEFLFYEVIELIKTNKNHTIVKINLNTNEQKVFNKVNNKFVEGTITQLDTNSDNLRDYLECKTWYVYLVYDQYTPNENWVLISSFKICLPTEGPTGGGGGPSSNNNNCEEMISKVYADFDEYVHIKSMDEVSQTSQNTTPNLGNPIIDTKKFTVVEGDLIKWEVSATYSYKYYHNQYTSYDPNYNMFYPVQSYKIDKWEIVSSDFDGTNFLYVTTWKETSRNVDILDNDSKDARVIAQVSGTLLHKSRAKIKIPNCCEIQLESSDVITGNKLTWYPK